MTRTSPLWDCPCLMRFMITAHLAVTCGIPALRVSAGALYYYHLDPPVRFNAALPPRFVDTLPHLARLYYLAVALPCRHLPFRNTFCTYHQTPAHAANTPFHCWCGATLPLPVNMWFRFAACPLPNIPPLLPLPGFTAYHHLPTTCSPFCRFVRLRTAYPPMLCAMPVRWFPRHPLPLIAQLLWMHAQVIAHTHTHREGIALWFAANERNTTAAHTPGSFKEPRVSDCHGSAVFITATCHVYAYLRFLVSCHCHGCGRRVVLPPACAPWTLGLLPLHARINLITPLRDHTPRPPNATVLVPAGAFFACVTLPASAFYLPGFCLPPCRRLCPTCQPPCYFVYWFLQHTLPGWERVGTTEHCQFWFDDLPQLLYAVCPLRCGWFPNLSYVLPCHTAARF